MKKNYTKYYKSASILAPFVFMFDGLFTKNKREKISLYNRQKDYNLVSQDLKFLKLHESVTKYLHDATTNWDAYDYGEGYLYQGIKSLKFSGLRDTEARIENMKLKKLVKGKKVLEIGCNSGFLSIELADDAKEIVAFDLNPYLISIAKECSSFAGKRNITFKDCSFSSLDPAETYDVVLSFANHSTYDGKTDQSIVEYFTKCHNSLKKDGLLVFESHPPEHEGKGLEKVCEIIEKNFEITKREILHYGTFLDTARTFILAKKRDL